MTDDDLTRTASLSQHEAAKLIGVPRSVLQRARATRYGVSQGGDFRPGFIAGARLDHACPLTALCGKSKSVYDPTPHIPALLGAAVIGQEQGALMRVFHRTSANIASDILCQGFRDMGGIYMTDSAWEGVWVSDIPSDANECA